jgi:two-component system response regulator FlrC
MPEAVASGASGFETLPTGFLASASTMAALAPLESVLKRDIPVLIYGETGTGKDVLARAIHHASGRGGPLVPVNCAAIPEGMAEALLFGHRKGAFTGAQRASQGYLRAAHGGTLFLDEVADLPLVIQSKLLRALEERAVAPLGATQPVRADWRVLAACQEPLAALVEAGRFRRDLYARLRGTEVTLAPLRERRQEIVPLFQRLLLGHGLEDAALDPRFVEALCIQDWPHNVRDLEQLAAVLAATGKTSLTSGDLPERLRHTLPAADAASARERGPAGLSSRRKAWLSRHLHELVKLRTALEKHNGDVTNAALEVGLPRHRARRLLAAEAELADAGWR